MSGADARLNGALMVGIIMVLTAGVMLGEVAFSAGDYARALTDPGSLEAEVLWQVRLPRSLVALLVGASLGLAGAVLQGLLRNPLADPGVLGVSSSAASGAALAIIAGLATVPGAIEVAAMAGSGLAAGLLMAFAARIRAPEALILFGVALSSLTGALTALIFNLSPTPVATAEVMNWLLGSVQNRSFADVAWLAPLLAIALASGLMAGRGLRMLTLGEEVAATSALPMRRLKLTALFAAALAAGAATAVAGIIGFVGLIAPHLVRALVRSDPHRLLVPASLAGALMLGLADVLVRLIPSEQELKLGVIMALVGAPLFALIAAHAARGWRT